MLFGDLSVVIIVVVLYFLIPVFVVTILILCTISPLLARPRDCHCSLLNDFNNACIAIARELFFRPPSQFYNRCIHSYLVNYSFHVIALILPVMLAIPMLGHDPARPIAFESVRIDDESLITEPNLPDFLFKRLR